MFDVVGVGLNAVDSLVGLPRFPSPGEKLRMSAFTREGGGVEEGTGERTIPWDRDPRIREDAQSEEGVLCRYR